MQHKFLFIFFGIALCSTTMVSAQKADMNAEKAKVKLVIDEFYKTFETKDMNLLSNIVAHDSDMVSYGINMRFGFCWMECTTGFAGKNVVCHGYEKNGHKKPGY